MSLLLAQSGHRDSAVGCLLWG